MNFRLYIWNTKLLMKNIKSKVKSEKNQKCPKPSLKFCLSHQQLRELKVIYDIYDRDGKSNVNNKDIVLIFRTFGFDVIEDEIKRLLVMSGKSNEDKSDFDDIVKIIEMRLSDMNDFDSLKSSIGSFIDNSEGYSEREKFITLNSLKELIAKTGEDIPDDELKEMMMEANPDLRNLSSE